MDILRKFNAEKLVKLITEDKLTEVLEELMAYAKGKDKEMYIELIVHYNRINAARKERNMGVMSFKKEQREKNSIIVRLINHIDDLNKVYNQKRFILEFNGDIENFNDDMKLKVTNVISTLLERREEEFEIVGVYSGSIKIVVEPQNVDIDSFVSTAKHKLWMIEVLFKDIQLLNIFNEQRLFETITLSFYNLFLRDSFKIISVKEIFGTLNKHNLLEKSTFLYFLEGGFKGINLMWIDLSDMDLFKADLSGTDLSWANLSRASLIRTNLNMAQLSYANLKKADLWLANLSGADFTSANLSGASLLHANLSGANLMNVNLTNADLMSADLTGADLTKSNLFRTNFYKATLREANLTGANLTRSVLLETDLSKANLNGVDLTGTELREANLTEADLRGANFTGAKLVTSEQLLVSATLYQSIGLPYSIKNEILRVRPELFDDPNDGKTEVSWRKVQV